jgi:hypothetical protein
MIDDVLVLDSSTLHSLTVQLNLSYLHTALGMIVRRAPGMISAVAGTSRLTPYRAIHTAPALLRQQERCTPLLHFLLVLS